MADTKRMILIPQYGGDASYSERLFDGEVPDGVEKAGRLYPIPDDATVYMYVLTDDTRVSSPTRYRGADPQTIRLFDGGMMTIPARSLVYVRRLPDVASEKRGWEWPTTGGDDGGR